MASWVFWYFLTLTSFSAFDLIRRHASIIKDGLDEAVKNEINKEIANISKVKVAFSKKTLLIYIVLIACFVNLLTLPIYITMLGNEAMRLISILQISTLVFQLFNACHRMSMLYDNDIDKIKKHMIKYEIPFNLLTLIIDIFYCTGLYLVLVK